MMKGVHGSLEPKGKSSPTAAPPPAPAAVLAQRLLGFDNAILALLPATIPIVLVSG
jgi:hypothetical protein